MRLIAFVPITPLLGAVLICWIFSVCVHEFSHAIVAYWGGDTSVRQRGYLSFNPFCYIHPVTSILLPCVFLLMGGVPLPGGISASQVKFRSFSKARRCAGIFARLDRCFPTQAPSANPSSVLKFA